MGLVRLAGLGCLAALPLAAGELVVAPGGLTPQGALEAIRAAKAKGDGVQRDFYAPLMVFRRKERKGRKDYAEQATWGRAATRWLKNSSSRFDL
jgi:hypothetical protein